MRLMKRPRFGMPLTRLSNEIDQIFDRQFGFGGEGMFAWSPAVDVFEDKDKLTVKAELPGFKREDINLSLRENNLIITGERRSEEEHAEGEFYRSERYFGKVHREVPLPSSVDADKIDAKYHDGVLTVTLPKSDKAKGRQIKVSIG